MVADKNALIKFAGQEYQGKTIAYRLRQHSIALAFFALLAFLTLSPILFNNGSHVTGYDYYNSNWSMWWIRHALTTPGQNIFLTNYLMAPHVNNLSYHALALVWYPVWAVLEPIAGTLSAITVIILVGCILNGYLFFVFLRSERVGFGLALIGGAALQLSPVVRYFYYNSHINLMDWFWLPLHLLVWKQVVSEIEARRFRLALLWALAQGVLLWGLILTDLEFPIFLALLLVPYGLVTLWRSRHRGQVIVLGSLIVLITLLLAWVAGPLPYMLHFSGTLAPGPVEDRPGIPFPSGYLTLYAVWWNWDTPTLGGYVTIATLISLGLSLSRWRRYMNRDRWLWFALLFPPLIVSMGPTLNIGGLAIPLPFRLLHSATQGNFRMPWRLGPVYVIAAMIFVCMTWTPLLKRVGNLRVLIVATALLLLFIDIRVFQTAPLDPLLYPYQFYEQMGREQGAPYDDYVVVEVPTAAGTGEVLIGDPHAISFEYYGMTHGKRMINGFISRAPVENFWSLRTDDPLLSWLGQRRLLEPKLVEFELRKIIYEWPVGYIVIHENTIGLSSSINQEIIGYFNTLPDLLCPVFFEHNAVVYRTAWHPDGCPARTPPEISPGIYQIDIGAPGDERFIGWGWHYAERIGPVTLRWAGAYPQTNLYVDVPPGAYELSLSAQAYQRERQLTVQVNGVTVGTSSVSVDSLGTLTFNVPASAIGNGKHTTVTLIYDGVDVPSQVGVSQDQRKLSVMVDWVRFSRTSN